MSLVGVNEWGLWDSSYDPVSEARFGEVVVTVKVGGKVVSRGGGGGGRGAWFEFVWPLFEGGEDRLREIRKEKKRGAEAERERVDEMLDFCDDDDSDGVEDNDNVYDNDNDTEDEDEDEEVLSSNSRRVIADDSDSESGSESKVLQSHYTSPTPPPNPNPSPSPLEPPQTFTFTSNLPELQQSYSKAELLSLSTLFSTSLGVNSTPILCGACVGFGDEISSSGDGDHLVAFGSASGDDSDKLSKSKQRQGSEQMFSTGLNEAMFYGMSEVNVTLNTVNDKRGLNGRSGRRLDRYYTDTEREVDVGVEVEVEVGNGNGSGSGIGSVEGNVEVNNEFMLLPSFLSDTLSDTLPSELNLLGGKIGRGYFHKASVLTDVARSLFLGGTKIGKYEQFVGGVGGGEHFNWDRKCNNDYLSNYDPGGEEVWMSGARKLDRRLVLDYVPFLRVISHAERKNKKKHDAEERAAELEGGRRRRRGGKRYMFYFDKIVLNKNNGTSGDISDLLLAKHQDRW